MIGSAGSGETAPILVTGGTGFLGSHLVDRLCTAGIPVRIVSRRGGWPWGGLPAGADLVPLDLTDPACGPRLREALDGTYRVVNLAGALMRPGRTREFFHRLHVEGVQRLLDAARTQGSSTRPVRFVHVSTTGVLGPTGPESRDESCAPRPSTPYEATKLEGESRARAARGRGLEVVVLRPGLVYGPRDLHLRSLFRSIRKGTFRTIGGGRARWQPIYVDDVARALESAVLTPGLDGELFHVAGTEVVSVREFAERIAGTLGVALRSPSLPYPIAWTAGWVIEAVSLPLGLEPSLSRGRVRTLTEDRLYAVERIHERLRFRPAVGLDEGLSRSVAWYRAHGLL